MQIDDAVKVNFPDGHKSEIQLNEDIMVVMKYPNLDYFTKVNFTEEETIDNSIETVIQYGIYRYERTHSNTSQNK